ncbi:hypothetical protein K438DRAFT_1977372 [Mycena galopus ATCC 62051]|nr:hypothetical protein K438DRAFT_1977372 [Mycena galopus ATCC 62051]
MGVSYLKCAGLPLLVYTLIGGGNPYPYPQTQRYRLLLQIDNSERPARPLTATGALHPRPPSRTATATPRPSPRPRTRPRIRNVCRALPIRLGKVYRGLLDRAEQSSVDLSSTELDLLP